MATSPVDFAAGVGGNIVNDALQTFAKNVSGHKPYSFHEVCLTVAFNQCLAKMLPGSIQELKDLSPEEYKTTVAVITNMSFALGHEFWHKCHKAEVDEKAHEKNHGAVVS